MAKPLAYLIYLNSVACHFKPYLYASFFKTGCIKVLPVADERRPVCCPPTYFRIL